MKYRRLGKTNLTVSVIGLGTWQFGGEWGKQFAQDEVNDMVTRAGALGINLIDTAECYGDHLSESLIGDAIAGQRDKWIIATKFGHKFHGHLNRTDQRCASHVKQQLDDSLRALKTDYIDLYQFHSVRDSEFDDPDLRRVLEDAITAGKVRHLGTSVRTTGDPMPQIAGSPAAHCQAVQILYNRLMREPEAQALPECQRLGLGVLARVPLASGMLSGKYRPGHTQFPPGDFRAQQDAQKLEEQLRQVEQIRQAEVPPGLDMAQWAIAWCLQHPAVTCTIPGCMKIAQVNSNAHAADLDLVRSDHPLAAEHV